MTSSRASVLPPAEHGPSPRDADRTRDAGTAADVLARCRDLVEPALRSRIASLAEWPAEMAAYAFGWCDVGGAPRSGAGTGKGVRQALTVLSAEAVGASGADAVDGAVAVELVHTFSLLHDDIMDRDEFRRQRPTAWKAYGTGPAVLAGDALFALAVETVAGVEGPQSGPAVRQLAAALQDLVRGQADDLLLERRSWTGPDAVGVADYLTVAEHKTGSLLGCASGLGAILGGAPAPTVRALTAAGRHLGIAFQAMDDFLGMWGDPAVTGKPVHSDLRRNKKTLPVLTALAGKNRAAEELAELLTAPAPLSEEGLRQAARLVAEAGGRTATLDEARRQADAAEHCLRGVPLAPRAREELLLLVPFVLHRDM